jgi:hypothetical protein
MILFYLFVATVSSARGAWRWTSPDQTDERMARAQQKESFQPVPGRSEGTAALEVSVTDAQTSQGLPCRLTIIHKSGRPASLGQAPDQHLAVREGVAYTPDGRARLRLAAGDYTLYVNRGMEYGMQRRRLILQSGSRRVLRLVLRREVPTPGLISCDTHIHTLTYSKHGDALADERMVTLAGEGIELPISTEHNRSVEYNEAQNRLGLSSYFTPVAGAEITTRKGHFNIFPIKRGSPVPDPAIEDWPRLMKSFRETPGVSVVVLNHPRDLHDGFRPFDPSNFNPVTGENLRGPAFSFDAVEVVNSSAQQADFMRPYLDWFALLNYGYHVAAVGSSDSHDVNKYIVGQARTYIFYADDDKPFKINDDQAWHNLLRGKALVSFGLLTQMDVDEKFTVGDLAKVKGAGMRVRVKVSGPSWIKADRVELYMDGIKIRERRIRSKNGAIEKARLSFRLPRPGHDVYLVAIASGPGITAPYWPVAPPYQPASSVWTPRMIGSTNPIRVDADADGVYTSPRAYAESIWRRYGSDPSGLLRTLGKYDGAVAEQAASFLKASGHDPAEQSFVRLLRSQPPHVRRAFTSGRPSSPGH